MIYMKSNIPSVLWVPVGQILEFDSYALAKARKWLQHLDCHKICLAAPPPVSKSSSLCAGVLYPPVRMWWQHAAPVWLFNVGYHQQNGIFLFFSFFVWDSYRGADGRASRALWCRQSSVTWMECICLCCSAGQLYLRVFESWVYVELRLCSCRVTKDRSAHLASPAPP